MRLSIRPVLGLVSWAAVLAGTLLYPGILPAAAQTTTTGGQGSQGGVAVQLPSTVPMAVPSAPAGSVPGGFQPSVSGSPTNANVTSAPAPIQLGPVQGLGGGIRPPRLLPSGGSPLTLDDAVRISLANNLNLFTAASQEHKASKRVKETQADFLPRFGLNGNYTYTGKVAQATFPSAGGGAPNTISLGTHQNYGGSVAVTQPIDTSGALGATKGIAEAQHDAQYWALDSARRQVILTTSGAYVAVLRAQDALIVEREILADAQAHVALEEKFLAAGTIARYDLLTAQTSLANVQQQVFTAQTAYNQAIAGLNNAMGISQATTLQLAALTSPRPTIPEFTSSLATALKNRPELLQIDANIKTAQESVRLAESGLKPSLGLQANYNYTGITAGFNNLHDNWTLGVVGSWDPFDWGATQARRDQSREDVTTNRYVREQTAQGIEYQVRQAINQINDATQRRTAAQAAVTQAREQLRLSNVRFGAGAGTNTEVIDAEAALAQAENNSASALYDYYTAYANYERATGTEPMAAETIIQAIPGPKPASAPKHRR